MRFFTACLCIVILTAPTRVLAVDDDDVAVAEPGEVSASEYADVYLGDIDPNNLEVVGDFYDSDVPDVDELIVDMSPYWDKYIADLEANAQAMKDKEQSAANKLIGAAGIGLASVGLSDTLEGMAESAADEDAEQAMKAYLQTFRCNWGGGGMSYKGGDTNIELPGADALTDYVVEYKALAAKLKEAKIALGMKPGIESEVIIDSAATGLYDDERHGIESGAFTSVSRALLDENGEDAAAWKKQQEDTKKKTKTGTAVAGVGAIGSAVANVSINGKNKEQSDNITAEYKNRLEELKAGKK